MLFGTGGRRGGDAPLDPEELVRRGRACATRSSSKPLPVCFRRARGAWPSLTNAPPSLCSDLEEGGGSGRLDGLTELSFILVVPSSTSRAHLERWQFACEQDAALDTHKAWRESPPPTLSNTKTLTHHLPS